MRYQDQLLNIIDQRIRAHAERITAMGTVQSRDPDGVRAMVTLDGSTVAVPVKVIAGLRVLPDDRVGLVRFGSDWVVAISFGVAAASANEASLEIINATPTTFTAANTNLAGGSRRVTKDLAATRMRVTIHGSAFRSVASYSRLTYGVDIGGVKYDVGTFGFSSQNVRQTFGMHRTIDPIPAGEYTVQVYGRGSVSGIDVAADDSWSMRWEEIY